MLQRGDFRGGNHETGGVKRTGGRLARAAIRLTGIAVLALAAAPPALASTGGASHHNSRRYHKPAIEVVAITPGPGDTAGAGGVFNVDLAGSRGTPRATTSCRQRTAISRESTLLEGRPSGLGSPTRLRQVWS